MNLKSLFEDESISLEDLLKGNNAKWHKSCNRKFNTTERKRAKKRTSVVCSDSEDTEGVRKKQTRRSLPATVPMKANICFL